MRGFTIIEVITAVFLLTIGVMGVFALINRSISTTSILRSRLVAAYLAQEGIEIMRNLRDKNWLEGNPEWYSGVLKPDCGVKYDSVQCDKDLDPQYLVVDPSGFYNYGAGTPTTFKRIIHLKGNDLDADGKPDMIEVTVTVVWSQRGGTNTFLTREQIFNWR